MVARIPRSTPEALGITSSAIASFVQATEAQVGGLHSFMLVRHGQVAAEAWWSPYAAEHPHQLFSLSKSFTSTAVGLAVAEGRLTVEDPVLSFFEDKAPKRSSRNLTAMRVKHLLTMNTGHDMDTLDPMVTRRGGDWARAFLSLPVAHRPGTHFLYNTGATYMLSAIVQRLTGMTLLDYLTPRLFEPLGIVGATWESCPQGVNTGGFGLSVRTEDIACLGQLYLQKGFWQGQCLLPVEWVDAASQPHSDNSSQPTPDWQQGYGYQFWRCRHGAYRGDGAFGQFCIIMPEQDAVLVITSGVRDMQAVLNLVWRHLLPAMRSTPLAADGAAQAALGEVLSSRAIAPVDGLSYLPAARAFNGRYILEDNPYGLRSATLHFGRTGANVRLQSSEAVTNLTCSPASWQPGEVEWRKSASSSPRRETLPNPPVLASGAWVGEARYLIRLCYYETPFIVDLDCRLGAGLTLLGSVNTSFGPTEWPPIAGHKP